MYNTGMHFMDFASHTGWLYFILPHGTSTKPTETLKSLYQDLKMAI